MKAESLDDQMAGIAKAVARRYHTRCWWTDLEDLEQQAWVVVLEVLRKYAPQTEAGELDRKAFGSWAYVAAMKQLSRYIWRQSAPVSASDHDVSKLAGLHRAEVPEDMLAFAADPEQAYAAAEIKHRAKEHVASLYSYMTGEPPDEWSDAVVQIYMQDREPTEVAHDEVLDRRGIYKTTEHMRALMRRDRWLRRLARQMQEERV